MSAHGAKAAPVASRRVSLAFVGGHLLSPEEAGSRAKLNKSGIFMGSGHLASGLL